MYFNINCYLIFADYSHHSNEFFTAFPKNGKFVSFSTPKLHITTNELTPVNVTISTSLGYHYSTTVQTQSTATVVIDDELTVASISDTNNAIHIKTSDDKKVAVYATSFFQGSAGAFAVLPQHTYDIPEYIYYAFSSNTTDNTQTENSTVVLVSGHNDTQVLIKPSQAVTIPSVFTGLNTNIVVQAGHTYSLTMNKTQTLLLESNQDLSGSKIVSNQPISVITGHECGNIPYSEGYCDHMVQQIPPTVTWGKSYMSLPFAKRSTGAVFKITSAKDDTQIIITCGNLTDNTKYTIVADLAYDGQIYTHTVSSNKWCSFVSNKIILVTQFAEGGAVEQLGDPLSITLTPLEQYENLGSQTITVPLSPFDGSNTVETVISIFVKNELPENVTLDGELLDSDLEWVPIFSNDSIVGYAISITDISTKTHIIHAPNNLFMSLLSYGYRDKNDAYGYPINSALDPINCKWINMYNYNSSTML